MFLLHVVTFMVAGSSYNDTGVKKEDLLPFMVDIGLAPSNTEEPQPLGADGISVALGSTSDCPTLAATNHPRCLPLIDVIAEFARPYTKFPAGSFSAGQ